jgi:hypothetical protein
LIISVCCRKSGLNSTGDRLRYKTPRCFQRGVSHQTEGEERVGRGKQSCRNP